MATGRSKKLVYVSEDLIDKIIKVSKEEGVSLNRLVESALDEVVKINDLGYKSSQMAEFFNVLQTNRVLGGLFVPSGVIEFMIHEVYKKDREQLRSLWYESGNWNGKYLKEKFENPIAAFSHFLELSRWDLNEVDVKNHDNIVRVRCISTIMSEAGTDLLTRYIEGIFHAMNYQTMQNTSLKGMIILEFKK